jgi:hypothetical protein
VGCRRRSDSVSGRAGCQVAFAVWRQCRRAKIENNSGGIAGVDLRCVEIRKRCRWRRVKLHLGWGCGKK